MVFEDKFTTEGAIIIALATVPIILLAVGEVRRRWPLKMAFDEARYHAQAQQRLHGAMAIGLGRHNLYVVLRPRTPILDRRRVLNSARGRSSMIDSARVWSIVQLLAQTMGGLCE